jgi:hypothetical protein
VQQLVAPKPDKKQEHVRQGGVSSRVCQGNRGYVQASGRPQQPGGHGHVISTSIIIYDQIKPTRVVQTVSAVLVSCRIVIQVEQCMWDDSVAPWEIEEDAAEPGCCC